MRKPSSHPVRDATPGEVIGTELDADGVTGQDADEVLAQLSGDVREHLVPVLQSHLEHRVRQGEDHLALDLDGILFRQARTLVLAGNQRNGVDTRKGRRTTATRTESIPQPPDPVQGWLLDDHRGAVSTRGPSAVTAMVFSKCAASLPSTVRTVQPSSFTVTSSPPRVNIGSIAKHMPGSMSNPVPGRP